MKKWKSLALALSLSIYTYQATLSEFKLETGFKQHGLASFYHDKFHGRKTSSGSEFSQFEMTAAHRWLPFGSKVRVYDPRTSKSVIVEINDRGPYKTGRIIDLSKSAAKKLGILKSGIQFVNIELLTP